MDAFSTRIQEWQMFYATLATTTATLVGLLFVSLSINIDLINQPQNAPLLIRARQAFASFLYILTISLNFLIPHSVTASLGPLLVILSALGIFGLARRMRETLREPSDSGKLIRYLREYWLLVVAYLGMFLVAIGVLLGNTDSLYWLVGVWMVLLVSASRDCWTLLVQVRGSKKDAG
jgi:hypothetical protein